MTEGEGGRVDKGGREGEMLIMEGESGGRVDN